jgi:hypothetical protein
VAWKRKALKAPWYTGEMISVGIGQGYFTFYTTTISDGYGHYGQ